MPSSRSSRAAWKMSGPKTIFCASNRASMSEAGAAASIFTRGIVAPAPRRRGLGCALAALLRRERVELALAGAADRLDAVEPAVEGIERLQDLQPQEFGARHRLRFPLAVLAAREQLRGVV